MKELINDEDEALWRAWRHPEREPGRARLLRAHYLVGDKLVVKSSSQRNESSTTTRFSWRKVNLKVLFHPEAEKLQPNGTTA